MLLASLRFVKIFLTALVLMIYSRVFGIGIQMDSWVFASGITAYVGLALWGPVNELVRSRFVRQVSEAGEKSARTSATSLLIFTLTASVLVCFVLLIGAPQVVTALLGATEPAARSLVLKIFVIMLPSIIIGPVLSQGIAYMNCYGAIYAPEFMGIATALLNMACVLALNPLLGIYSLVFGYYLGAVLSLIVVLHFLRSRGILRGVAGARAILKDAGAVIIFAAPLFFSYGSAQMNGLLEKYLASLMGVGVISSVYYASQIKSALQAVLSSVLFSLIVPRLTQAASQWGGGEFKRMFAESQRVAMMFVLIVLPFVFGAADSLAAILFSKAATSASAQQEIALLIRLYAAALVPVVLYLVYGVALLAQEKGGAYATLGVTAQLMSALFCVAMFRPLGPQVFPIALLLSHLAAALLMLHRIDLQGRRAILAEASGFIVLLAAASVAVMLAGRSLSDASHSSLLSLGLLGLAYGIVVLVMVIVFNCIKSWYGKLKVF